MDLRNLGEAGGGEQPGPVLARKGPRDRDRSVVLDEPVPAHDPREQAKAGPEAKFNFKEASKQIQGAIKEQQRKILKCEEMLSRQEKKRDELTAELLTAQGAAAAALAKELNQCGLEIARLEEDILRHMELQQEKESELAALKS